MSSSLAQRIKDQARLLGFDLAGVAPAAEADGFAHLQSWLAQGYAGEMAYLHRHAAAHRHPAGVLPSVRSVVMVALNYAMKPETPVAQAPGSPNAPPAVLENRGRSTDPGHVVIPGANDVGDENPRAPGSSTGKISRYAQGTDYHDVVRRKLHALLDRIQEMAPGTSGRAVVDSAPLLERDFARRAGLGWFGKNTMLLNKRLGSWFFLGALLLDLDLPADPPFAADHCGTCTACLDACPTGAFVAPRQLDARRCISYLTIELRGSIPEELRPGMGDWIFGCDVCQEVCPWNRKAPPGQEAELQPRSDLEAPDLVELLSLTPDEFRRRYRHTALWRTQRRGLLRNVAIVLGNGGDARALPALQHALSDADDLVREAAAWAIQRIRSRLA